MFRTTFLEVSEILRDLWIFLPSTGSLLRAGISWVQS
jgi:hypothetical protein